MPVIMATHAGLHSAEKALNWHNTPKIHCISCDKPMQQICNTATEIGDSYLMSAQKPQVLTGFLIQKPVCLFASRESVRNAGAQGKVGEMPCAAFHWESCC